MDTAPTSWNYPNVMFTVTDRCAILAVAKLCLLPSCVEIMNRDIVEDQFTLKTYS